MRPLLRTSSRALALLAVVALVAAGCSKSSQSPTDAAPSTTAPPANVLGTSAGPPDATTPPVDGGKLAFGLEAEPEGLDPIRYAFASSGHFVASAVFDPLATLDANGKAVPFLAKAIDPSDGFKTWTITIPTGVQFHDNTPLTAQVVVDNLEAYRKSIIVGGSLGIVSSVSATDDTKVVVKLSTPMVSFPTVLTTQVGYVIAEVMLNSTQMTDKPIGTGPFVIDSHIKDQIWSFKKNKHYWRAGLPHLDAIDFKPIPDNAKRMSDLQAGNLDVMNTRSPQQILDLRSSEFKRVENAAGEEEFILLNTQAPPFDNPIARQAVAAAIDTARWRSEVARDVDPPANSPFGPNQLGYLEDNGYPKYDLAKAKQLVEQYKTATGKDLSFTWVTQADLDVQTETQVVVDMLNQAGMTVEVTLLPQINLIAQIATGSYQMGRFRLFGHPNPDADASGFWRSSEVLPPPQVSLNFPRFADPKVDAAIDTAIATDDAKVRDTQYQIVNREFATNLPYIWLGRAVWMLAARPNVNGIYAATNGTIQTIGPKTWLADLWLGE